MTRWERYLNHGANIAVGGTGLVYAWMLYFMQPMDEFAVVNHPWQPSMQYLHVALAPLVVFGVGIMFKSHALKHLRKGTPDGLRSGIALLGTAAPMIFSGYFIQTAVNPSWRTVWVWVHVGTSLVWMLSYALHFVAGLGHRRAGKQKGPTKSEKVVVLKAGKAA